MISHEGNARGEKTVVKKIVGICCLTALACNAESIKDPIVKSGFYAMLGYVDEDSCNNEVGAHFSAQLFMYEKDSVYNFETYWITLETKRAGVFVIGEKTVEIADEKDGEACEIGVRHRVVFKAVEFDLIEGVYTFKVTGCGNSCGGKLHFIAFLPSRKFGAAFGVESTESAGSEP